VTGAAHDHAAIIGVRWAFFDKSAAMGLCSAMMTVTGPRLRTREAWPIAFFALRLNGNLIDRQIELQARATFVQMHNF